MKRSVLQFALSFLAITIFITCTSLAQNSFYKHMQGKVGDNINLVSDLVCIQNNLSGYYYYFYSETVGDESWTHYGKSMPIFGDLNIDNSLEFSEFDPEVKGAEFEGSMNKGTITGLWHDGNGSKKLPFELKEDYPLGTMAFNIYHLIDQVKLLDKAGSPVAKIELSLLLPQSFPDPAVVDSVKTIIMINFFEKSDLGQDVNSLLLHEREHYFTNYKASNESIYQEGAASFNWEKVKSLKIQHNENFVLSLACYDYGFTGGAHGLSFTKFKVVDLHDGHLMILDEIFRPDYINDLRDIINTELRKKYLLAKDQSLKDAGFFEHQVEPSTNFYVNKDGIGFYYNQYEVAPFAMGPIDLFISFRYLKRIMKTDGMLYSLSEQK